MTGMWGAMPDSWHPYISIMRLDRPIGWWLLLLPSWWTIVIASDTPHQAFWLMSLFLIGAIAMRAAGCVINDMWDIDIDRKTARKGWPKGKPDADAPLSGRVLAMVFEKNSTRTRVSFDMAIRQLGGSSIVMDAGLMQLGRGESIADTARVLSGYVDAIMIRTDDHAKVEEMAHFASVPVINGLTDLSHPCQIMADLLTVIDAGKALPGLKVAWLGDGNNVIHIRCR